MISHELFQIIKSYRVLNIMINIVKKIIRGFSKEEIHKKELGNTYEEPEVMSVCSLRYSVKIS